MSSPAARRAASPYARRLARERGIALTDLAGSGPNGRIVAADVPLEATAVPLPAAAALPEPASPALAPVAAARSVGAFSTSIALTALHELIAAAGTDVPLDAFLVKAAAHAAGSRAASLRLVAEGEAAVTFANPAGLAPSGIARLAAESTGEAAGRPLVLSRLRVSGVRPVAGALPADSDLRILVVAGDGAETGEAMLVHDADAIAETEAAGILSAFRDGLENPLRLLV